MKRSRSDAARVAAAVMFAAGLLAAGGCEQILGLDRYHLSEGEGGGICAPGTTSDCYAGPAGTEGVGICKAGKETCNEDGTAYGACEGEVVPQQEVCGNDGDEDCNGAACGQVMWGKIVDGGGAESAVAVGLDGSGNIFAAGTFTLNIDFGGQPLVSAGGSDIFLVKLAPDGSRQWSKRFGDAQSQTVAALAVAANGDVIISGQFEGGIDLGGGLLTSSGEDIYVARFGPDGKHLWSKSFGDTQPQKVDDVAVDSMGDVIAVGTFQGTLAFPGATPLSNADASDVFVAKLDGASGEAKWAKGFGDTGIQFATGVAVDSADSVIVTGTFYNSIDFGNAPLTELKAEAADVFVAKLDAQGGHSWSKRLGGASNDSSGDVAADSLGGVIVSGGFEGAASFGGEILSTSGAGDSDIFVAKFNPQGVHVWSQKIGDNEFQPGCSIAVLGDQSIWLTGQFMGALDIAGSVLKSAGGYDMFLAKLAANGTQVWGERFGDGKDQYITDIAADMSSGAVVVSGVLFQGSIDFGNGPLQGAINDALLARFAP